MYLGFSDNIERAKIQCFMITFLFKKVFVGGYGSIHTHPNMTIEMTFEQRRKLGLSIAIQIVHCIK
jgi:hypothetical protein